MKNVLVTGGLGYIGSHTVVELMNAGFNVEIIDDLSNSRIEILGQLEKITGVRPVFHQFNILDKDKLANVLAVTDFDAVIHFAAFKSVGESMNNALAYYENNLGTLISLLYGMQNSSLKNLIFSSSCTVYGETKESPITENTPTQEANSVYGTTKLMAERIISDVIASNDNNISAIALRYFNPAGAHETALIGEYPSGIPNNLFPYITQTYAGIREQLNVFGGDYNTPDGTAIRDYIHVVDLAKAHVSAVSKMLVADTDSSLEFINIGTGEGYSVLDVIHAFEDVTERKLNYKIVDRRPGDIEQIWADPSLAKEVLGWTAKYGIKDIVASAWKWEQYLSENI